MNWPTFQQFLLEKEDSETDDKIYDYYLKVRGNFKAELSNVRLKLRNEGGKYLTFQGLKPTSKELTKGFQIVGKNSNDEQITATFGEDSFTLQNGKDEYFDGFSFADSKTTFPLDDFEDTFSMSLRDNTSSEEKEKEDDKKDDEEKKD